MVFTWRRSGSCWRQHSSCAEMAGRDSSHCRRYHVLVLALHDWIVDLYSCTFFICGTVSGPFLVLLDSRLLESGVYGQNIWHNQLTCKRFGNKDLPAKAFEFFRAACRGRVGDGHRECFATKTSGFLRVWHLRFATMRRLCFNVKLTWRRLAGC